MFKKIKNKFYAIYYNIKKRRGKELTKKQLVHEKLNFVNWGLKATDKKHKKLVNSMVENIWGYYINDTPPFNDYALIEKNPVKQYELKRTIMQNSLMSIMDSEILNMVGVQPIDGPVGRIHHISQKKKPTPESHPSNHGFHHKKKIIRPKIPNDIPEGRTSLLELPDEKPPNYKQSRVDFTNTAIEARGNKYNTYVDLESFIDGVKDFGLDVEKYVYALINDHSREVQGKKDSIINLKFSIDKASNEIGSETERGVGNMLFLSPKILKLLLCEESSDFERVGNMQNHVKFDKIRYYGEIDGKSVFILPESYGEDLCYVGYKGTDGECDSGLIIAPYVPVALTGAMMHPETFQPIVGGFGRIGVLDMRELEDKSYYRKIIFDS